jgi:hypothetical protein
MGPVPGLEKCWVGEGAACAVNGTYCPTPGGPLPCLRRYEKNTPETIKPAEKEAEAKRS